jgi:hypothetical protein
MTPDIMVNVVKPWMDEEANRRLYVWQQDGSLARNSKKMLDWCRENMQFFWGRISYPPAHQTAISRTFLCERC